MCIITHNLQIPHLIPLPNHKTNEESFIREGDLEGVGRKWNPPPDRGRTAWPTEKRTSQGGGVGEGQRNNYALPYA